jgi:hypothetical protein
MKEGLCSSTLGPTSWILIPDEALLRQMVGCIFNYFFHSNLRNTGTKDADKLVECGVARFGARESLALAFKSPRHLGEVFEFVGSNGLAQEIGHLVVVHNRNGEFVAHPLNITSNALPTYILGHSPPDARQTLSWLEDPKRVIFCFPAHGVGPKLILLLQLSDKRLLRVLIQFKQKEKKKQTDTISPAETLKALESIKPRTMNSRPDSMWQINRYALVLIHLPNVSPSEQ